MFLDSTVVNVALPKIGEDLRSGLLGAFAAENFVYYSYLLSLSALLILAGALNEFFGRREARAISDIHDPPRAPLTALRGRPQDR